MRKRQMAISKCSKKNQRKSKNPLDKLPKVWYNKDVKREEKEKSKVCAEKIFRKSRKKT